MTQSMHMVSGRLGVDGGFYWNQSDDAIDVDDDGQYSSPIPHGIIDLSVPLSKSLGRQMPQFAVYRIGYIEIGLRNKDDSDDNSGAGCFGGTLKFHEPTSHKIDALQLARAVEKANEGGVVDSDSLFLTTDRSYAGMRVNYDGDSQIEDRTSMGVTGISGQWDMEEILAIYGQMLSPANTYSNSLWTRRTGTVAQCGWAASIMNRANDSGLSVASTYEPDINNWRLDLPAGAHLDVLNGLLKLTTAWSSTNDFQTTDDDYEIQVTIGVYGWESF